MKKTLFLAAMFGAVAANAQLLQSDNFDSYTVGNIGANTSGTTSGQGGMFTYNGSTSDYQITQIDAAHGNSVSINGGATATASASRFVWKNGLAQAWAARTPGNNILTASLEIYTGTLAGVHRIGSGIYDALGSGIVGIYYNTSTRTVEGMAKLTTGGGAPASYSITGLTSKTWPANTWIKVGYTYDSGTGVITYTIEGEAVTLQIDGYSTPSRLEPDEHDLINVYGTGNNAAYKGAIDNYQISASANAVLGVKTIGALAAADFAVYPNPATDFLELKVSEKVKAVSIFDTNGRTINAKYSDGKVDVRNLSTGMYIIKVETAQGSYTTKFIKK